MNQYSLRKALRTSYLISLVLAAALAGAFFAATTLSGNYNVLARYGGAVWIFLLSLIVALPTVTPLVKKRRASE